MNKYDLLLHVDKADGSINTALGNAANYAAALKGEKFNMVLVVNAKGVNELLTGSSAISQEKLKRALESGLEIKVCQNALNEHNIKAENLLPQCRIVPAGVVEIVERQREGYAYIKP